MYMYDNEPRSWSLKASSLAMAFDWLILSSSAKARRSSEVANWLRKLVSSAFNFAIDWVDLKSDCTKQVKQMKR